MDRGPPVDDGAAGSANDRAALRPLVIVLGMHRSGTSLCANILHDLGVDMADAAGASPANARGHWERPRINDLHEDVLRLFGRGWDSPLHHLALPDGWWADPRLESIREQFAAFLSARLATVAQCGFKDPRTSRLLKLWPPILREIGARPSYVVCVRDPAQVARSVTARDRLPMEQSAYRWLIYNADLVCGVGDASVCVVRYEDWFTAPQATLARLADFVGVAVPTGQALSTVDAGLRHDAPDGIGAVPPVAADLYRRMLSGVGPFDAMLRTIAGTILGCEQAVLPFLREAATTQVSIAEQNRVIADLQGLVGRLRAESSVFSGG